MVNGSMRWIILPPAVSQLLNAVRLWGSSMEEYGIEILGEKGHKRADYNDNYNRNHKSAPVFLSGVFFPFPFLAAGFHRLCKVFKIAFLALAGGFLLLLRLFRSLLRRGLPDRFSAIMTELGIVLQLGSAK